MNKQNLARWNRWLGWAFVVVTLFSIVTAYPRGNALVALDPKGALYQTLNYALIPLLALVHFGLTLYLFGFPRFSNGAKAWHVYIGYITFLVMFGSQSLIGPNGPIQPWFDYGNILMYILIVIHVYMGYQHWSARRSGADQMASIQRGAK
jgi:hypothetical protein